jgi:hypothetical protein
MKEDLGFARYFRVGNLRLQYRGCVCKTELLSKGYFFSERPCIEKRRTV